ncbi:DUF4184 family protein [Paenibacillus glycinis]|uniref:DUF4184 family protein n=1 Tax=Paenibacillus glycinis TaxID=2697035 RepID=A0ABW9XID4_9BACL|nr:DUF4184 family protein [Paenibacillus glycinis]NBD22381.1 DUF4184 family protein [Paenibacillus glycinis]
MPFTFSHPLFAVPLRRIAPGWLSVTGLLLGSMIPDMEYFMAMQSYQTIGHSLRGFLVQGVPLSIALAFAFHTVVKPAIPKFLPSVGHADQFAKSLSSEEWKLNSVRAWIVYLASLYIGYLTHLFMDSWSHGTGVFVKWFPVLRDHVGDLPAYQLLQYLLSLVGLFIPALLLFIRYRSWYAQAKGMRPPKISRPGTLLLLWATAAVFGFGLFAAKMTFSVDRYNWVSPLIVAPLSSALFGVFVASLSYRAVKNRKIAGGASAVALLLLALVLFRTSEYLLAPYQLHHASAHAFRAFKGDFQSVWNAYIWCWSAMLLLSCWLTANDRQRASARVGRHGRTKTF